MKTKYTLLALCAVIGMAGSVMGQTTYRYLHDSQLDAFLTPTGGTGNVTFMLSSGPAVPSLGSAFDVQLVFADSTPSGKWDAAEGGPGGNGLAFAGSFSMSEADASGVYTFGSFPSVAGYDVTWSYSPIGITSPNPPLTEDKYEYIGSDASLGGLSFTGTPDSFRYTEGSNLQSAGTVSYSVTFTPVPEPSGALLLGITGVLGILRRRRLA